MNLYFNQVAVETMSSTFALIDDKHVPFARIVWVADVPHFCGNEECTVEGRYEVRIEGDESLFATREERDLTLTEMREWFDPE